MSRLRQSLPTLRIVSDADTQGLHLRLDGIDIRADAYRAFRTLDPGRHELEIRTGERTNVSVITLAPGEQKTFELVLPPPTPASAPPINGNAATFRAQPEASRGMGPWVLVSGGAVSGVGAVVFWQLARGKETDLRQACYTADLCPTSAKAIHDEGARYTLAANISGGVGLAAVVAGLAWWLWPARSPSRPQSAGLTLTIAPERFALSGRF